MNKNKIVASLWYNNKKGDAKEVVEYYKKIFATNFKANKISVINETPGEHTEYVTAKLFNQSVAILVTEKKHNEFTDSFSFTINCKDQKEIDKYWNYFTKNGKVIACGWCNDKYGFRWQIVPDNLQKLLAKPNGFKIMIGQTKIVIKEYLK